MAEIVFRPSSMNSPFERSELLKREFSAVSDRAAAVVAGAFLDELLAALLREFMVEDAAGDKKIFQGTGPLATFSAKIDLAFRLGLVSQSEHRILHVVRSVRNEFAHSLEDLSFSSEAIKNRCLAVAIPKELVHPSHVPLSQHGEVPPLPKIVKADPGNPRAVFQEVVMFMLHALSGRMSNAGNSSRRKSPPPFKHAHEPIELTLTRMRELVERSDRLCESPLLNSEEKSELLKGTEEHRVLIKLNEFIVQQIKSAHAQPGT